MAGRKRRKGKAGTMRNTIRLGIVFALLVGINVYVFFFSSRSIDEVKKDLPKTEAAQIVDEGAAASPSPSPSPSPSAEKPGFEKHGTVKEGEGLGAVLGREGLTPPESNEVIRALAPIMNFKKEIRSGQKYTLRYDAQGRLVGFELRASPVSVYQVERGPDGKLVAVKGGAKTERRIEEIHGKVTSSLYAAVKDAGEQTELVATLVDLFAYDINFYVETHEGDRFKVIVEKQFIDGAFWRYGRILAAEYSGRVGTYRAFWWQADGAKTGGYFDEKGQNIAKSLLKTPLKFSRISSRFNPRRMHPVLHVERGHFGTDYAAPTGTPVWASASGKVTFVGRSGGAGNLIVLDHGGGLQTLYMHLSRFAKGLRVGQRVEQKQVIGYVGATGLATGPHLHFSVKRNGRYVDPQKLQPVRMPPVPAKQRDAFQHEIASRVATLSRLTDVASSGDGAIRAQ
jgi:murein DD-endopeptidase MepM/ murein hydrolase activator NlpD